MRKIENIHLGAVMCSPFYDIMTLLRMRWLSERGIL